MFYNAHHTVLPSYVRVEGHTLHYTTKAVHKKIVYITTNILVRLTLYYIAFRYNISAHITSK